MRQAVFRWICLLFLAAVFFPPEDTRAQGAAPPTVMVFDSSGSMAAVLPDGRTKLDAARAIVADVLASWPTGSDLAVIAYGHRRKSDCADIETVLPLGALSVDAVVQALRPLKARGKTPLSRSLQAAARLLPAGNGTIVLVSDGIETCDADPCAVAAALKRQNIALVVHVVGFGLKKEERAQLSCIAREGGGKFFDAKDAQGLAKALETVKVEVAAPPPPAPKPEPPPEPKPAPKPEPAPKLPPEPAPEPKSTPKPAPKPAPVPDTPKVVRTHLTAIAGALGAIISAPVHWTVQNSEKAPIYDGGGRALDLDLLPGRYEVTAAAANAKGVGTIDVSPGQDQSFKIPVDAGRLDLSLSASPGSPAYTDLEAAGVAWTLEPLDGQTPVDVPSVAKPELLLAPGAYRVHAAIQGLEAESPVAVAAGEAAPVALTFRLGTLVLEAALEGAEEPLDGAASLRWRVGGGAKAQLVEGEARPRMTLPEGSYPVVLTIAGTDIPAQAEVKAGEEKLVRVVVPGGSLSLSARLGPQSPPLDDWHDTFWTVTPIEVPGASSPIEVPAPNPTLPLPAGKWHVELKSGAATVGRDVIVKAGSPTVLTIDVDGGRLTANVLPGGDGQGANVVYAVTALDASGVPASDPVFTTGSSNGMSTILPAGRWHVIADGSDGHHAETDVDLKAGEEKTLDLELR